MKSHSPLEPWKGVPLGSWKAPDGEPILPGTEVTSFLIDQNGEWVRLNLPKGMDLPKNLNGKILARWTCQVPDPKTEQSLAKKERKLSIFLAFKDLYQKQSDFSVGDPLISPLLVYLALWLEREKVLKEVVLEPYTPVRAAFKHNKSEATFELEVVPLDDALKERLQKSLDSLFS
jgi:hypothetical protein